MAAVALVTACLFEATASAEPPPPPGTLSAAALSYSQVKLAWANESYGPSDFKVERDSGGGFVEITTVSSGGSEYPVALAGKSSLDLWGSPPPDMCSFDSSSSAADFDLKCGSQLQAPLAGSSGTLDCQGLGWSSVPVTIWPPDGGTDCPNYSQAPNPYPWSSVNAPYPGGSTALQDDGSGNCNLTAADVAAISPGVYNCANLVLGPAGNEILCTPAGVNALNHAAIYVTGALSFGNNTRVNVKYSTGGCTGSAMGPALGSGSYQPTQLPAAFRVLVSSAGAVDIKSGSNLPKAAMTLYAPSSWATCSGAPAFRLFGTFMLDKFTSNGCLDVLAYDHSLSQGASVTLMDEGLPPNTQYKYRIRATNTDGDSSYSNEVTVTTFGSLSGHVAGGMWGSISVYDSSGTRVAYECCMTSDFWQANVPASSCPAGGYRILWLPPDTSKSPSWFDAKQTFTEADCYSAPSMNIDMTATVKPHLSGYVKDIATSADLNNAYVYAFNASDGTFAGWSRAGTEGPGRYRISVPGGAGYKVKVVPPAGHVGEWYSGSTNFTAATPVMAPSEDVNFSLGSSVAVDGYVKDFATSADLNGYPVYAYSVEGQFLGYAITDRGLGPGRYRVEAIPGMGIKLLAGGGSSYAKQWYSGSTTFTSATPTAAPFTANFALSP